MTEQTSVEPARPVRNLLIGIGTPVAVICGFAALAALISVSCGNTGGAAVKGAAALGALIGALVSFYGLADIAIAYFLSRGRALDRHCRTIGYLTVWLAMVAVLMDWRY